MQIEKLVKEDKKEIELEEFKTLSECLKYYLNQLDYLKYSRGKFSPLKKQRNIFLSLLEKWNIKNDGSNDYFDLIINKIEEENLKIINNESKLSKSEREYIINLVYLLTKLLEEGLPQIKKHE